MIAKLIAHAPTREAALEKLATALDRTLVVGPRTNLAFLRALLATPVMRQGAIDTTWIEREGAGLVAATPPDHAAAAYAVEELLRRDQARIAARARRRSDERRSPWDAGDAFGLRGDRNARLSVVVNGEPAIAEVCFDAKGTHATVEGGTAAPSELIDTADGLIAIRGNGAVLVRLADAGAVDLEHLGMDGIVSAPMHGKVLAIEVKQGERVHKGQRLAVIEAMKMEHTLTAHADGVVAEVSAEPGNQVAEGARLIVIRPQGSDERH
jgi:3-methylcrotonyl-CoA carboxylase alpha subunit